jgi:hypothetical protein
MTTKYREWLLHKLIRYGTTKTLRDSTSRFRKMAFDQGHVAYLTPIRIAKRKLLVNGPFVTAKAVEYLEKHYDN